ncbi:sugar phosphate isomerase/epimerase [Massilia sp. B-10]|nr:sugar phosphate isomerase/epimerase [Massilia sp. B-10]
MRLSISNIAWELGRRRGGRRVAAARAIDAIDIAPGKYFPDPAAATDADIARAQLVAGARDRDRRHAGAAVRHDRPEPVRTGPGTGRHAGPPGRRLPHRPGLGATRIVFGSPKNRDRGGLSDEQALQAALPFFARLGEIAHRCGVTVCLEPNPTCYGANFMTTTADTASVVGQLGHPAIRMQLDTGALTINGEDAATRTAALRAAHRPHPRQRAGPGPAGRRRHRPRARRRGDCPLPARPHRHHRDGGHPQRAAVAVGRARSTWRSGITAGARHEVAHTRARHRHQCLGQRAGENGDDAAAPLSVPGRTHGGPEQLAVLAGAGPVRRRLPAVRGGTGAPAPERGAPGTDGKRGGHRRPDVGAGVS